MTVYLRFWIKLNFLLKNHIFLEKKDILREIDAFCGKKVFFFKKKMSKKWAHKVILYLNTLLYCLDILKKFWYKSRSPHTTLFSAFSAFICKPIFNVIILIISILDTPFGQHALGTKFLKIKYWCIGATIRRFDPVF